MRALDGINFLELTIVRGNASEEFYIKQLLMPFREPVVRNTLKPRTLHRVFKDRPRVGLLFNSISNCI